MPLWLEWSRGYSIPVSNLTLRTKKRFSAIEEKTDAIFEFFYRKKGNAKSAHFDGSQELTIFLVLSAKDYKAALHHQARVSEDGDVPIPTSTAGTSKPVQSVPLTTIRGGGCPDPSPSTSTMPNLGYSQKRARSDSVVSISFTA